VAIPDGFEVGLDRTEALLQHLALRDGPGVLELLPHLAPDEGQALYPVSMLRILVRRLCWRLLPGSSHRASQCGLCTGLFDLLFDGFAFPTSGHFCFLSHF
jgi:hypothetical protein